MHDKKIAFDFDGVIADTGRKKMEWIKNRGIPVKNSDKTSFYKELSCKLSKIEIDKIYKEMAQSIFLPEVLNDTQPVENAIETIKKLSLNYDVYIITARTEKLIEPVKTWLKKYNINQNIKEIISSFYESKQDICLKNNIYFLCDDDLRHLTDKKINLKVWFNKGELEKSEDIIIAKSWQEIENILLNKK